MTIDLNPSTWQGKIYSAGWRTSGAGNLAVVEPATGEQLAIVGMAAASDVVSAAARARSAQPSWASTPLQVRADVFRRAARLLEESFDSFANWIVRETGGIRAKAMFELTSVVTQLHEAGAMLTQPQGLLLPSDDGCTSIARRMPHGVVGIISPFNFPFLLSARALAPALATGNAVILKPDPRTPVSGGVLLALLMQAAGLPEDVLHVLPGGAEAGEALVTDPNITMISFTGSTQVGRRVGELAGKHLKKAALELGGKNSLIILDDADLDSAVACGAFASWFHQGQICMSAGRHLVHRDIAEAYATRLAEKARVLPVGNPFTDEVALGPLITAKQLERVHRIVDETVGQGAQLLAGGSARKLFYSPTVLHHVEPHMSAFREEIFGPVASISVFDSDEQAVALANDTEYGLSAGILTATHSRAVAIASRLNVGLVHINDQTVNDNGFMPMGGRGASGNGSRHGGPANWDEFTQWQWSTYRSAPPQYPF
ncbi:benzaldehyde dehydrogenase (NAD+) [Burkholderia sp. D7]|nr:benzaldehyde dehydrogenase (NAD+) [Burkholderia sp. D7]